MTLSPRAKAAASVGILAWAATLQWHMAHLKSTPEFRQRFPDLVDGEK